MAQGRVEGDAPDPISDHDPYPRIEPGVYEVRCNAVRQYRSRRFRRFVCRLDCQLPFEQVQVCGFLNLGSADNPQAGRGSHYWRAWVMANGAQPGKRQRLSRSVFVGKFFRVRIGWVEKRHDQTLHSEAERYSTIQEWIACTGP